MQRAHPQDDASLAMLLNKFLHTCSRSNTNRANTHATSASAFLQSLLAFVALAPQQRLRNPGVAYVEARGAEAGFLQRLAQLIITTESHRPDLIVTTNLTPAAFREVLSGFAKLMPSAENRAVIDTLLDALNANRMTLNAVTGSQPLRVDALLRATGAMAGEVLVLSADAALVVCDDVAMLHYVLWTLAGHTLVIDDETRGTLIEAAQLMRSYGGRPGG
jgi:hypothetical protein